MGLALYGPGGYYQSDTRIGAGGDYYTSPKVHPVFGALLAGQLEQMWRLCGHPDRFQVIEPGAGDGTLAADILAFANVLDARFARALSYTAIDRSPPPSNIANELEWVTSNDLPVPGIIGCVLSNELIDSFPIHRVRLNDRRLQELFVAVKDGRFAEAWDEPSTGDIASRLAFEGVRLHEGWEGEVNLHASQWMERVARGLVQGYVLTIDYGDEAARLYSARRARGTVMSYYRHTLQSDPLNRVGRQDITAHANFTTLIQAGLKGGLQPAPIITQAQFLRNLGIEAFREVLAQQHEPESDLRAIQALIAPEGLGKFRVLVQSKNTTMSTLAGLGNDPRHLGALKEKLRGSTGPRLSTRHINLSAGPDTQNTRGWMTGSWNDILGNAGEQEEDGDR